jgi:CheY-like chemotaxis protein
MTGGGPRRVDYHGTEMTVRILLVEDEPRIAEVAQQYLEREGYMVVWRATGEDALVDLTRRLPEALILDLGLPGISGEEVCRRVRESSDVPILMLTARDAEEDLVKGLALGAEGAGARVLEGRPGLARMRDGGAAPAQDSSPAQKGRRPGLPGLGPHPRDSRLAQRLPPPPMPRL